MKRFLIILLTVLACDASHASQDGKSLINNIFRTGVQAVQSALKPENSDLQGDINSSSSSDPSGAFSRVIVDSLEKSIAGIKERYKQEGRTYVRELGNIIAERIVHNERVQSVIFTLRALCWAIIAYLILVTILLLVSLQRLRANDRRILELLQELKQKESGP